MLMVFYLMLMFTVGGCTTQKHRPEIQTASVGDDVNLTCERKSTGSLIWIRFVRGHTLEVLGKTYSYEANPRITASEKPGIFVLHIKNANPSDTALYFCLKIRQTVTILNETDLRVEGPKPGRTTAPTSAPEHSLSLQNTTNKKCGERTCVYCCTDGSDQSDSCYDHNTGCYISERERFSGKLSPKTCMCCIMKTSDFGGNCSALSTCEMKSPTSRRNLTNEDTERQDGNDVIIFPVLIVSLAACLVIIVVLIIQNWNPKKKSYITVALQTDTEDGGNQENQQITEESLIYASPTFTTRASTTEKVEINTYNSESVYSDIKCLSSNRNVNTAY
uniref:Immunoglobulin subtype domain-containing protein n=1 Tax=Cynoglossus semilaevis TaxID=244447 RepID=A0A3P8URP9_CYNSE